MYALTERYRVKNPRVFGSVVTGCQGSQGDIDLLVDATACTTLFDMGGLRQELSQLLNAPVDVVTLEDLSASFRSNVIANAKLI